MADAVRRALIAQRGSFVFETVFSDPVGDKVEFLVEAEDAGYSVVLCFIGIDDVSTSIERVSMRVSQGGHDVPDEKLQSRFPRVLENLRRAARRLRTVLVFDNSDMGNPFRRVAAIEEGSVVESSEPTPDWLRPILP